MLKFIVVGLRFDLDVVDYPRREKRLYRTAGHARDLFDYDKIKRLDRG